MHTTTSEIQAISRDSSNVTIHAPGEGQAIWFLDNLATVKASGSDGARFGLMESALPEGSETPFHRHYEDDESFYILDGVMTLFLEGGKVVEARPGTFVRIPCGTAHGFRTKTGLRMLVLSDPGGFVDFVRDFGVPAPRRELPPAAPPDLPRLVSTAARHRIELLGPLPE
jgi:quercetin dioxygenase-like cupin family protein